MIYTHIKAEDLKTAISKFNMPKEQNNIYIKT